MAKNETNILWIAGLILIGILLYRYSSLGAIALNSPQVQYFNKPVVVNFQTELTNFTYQSYFNDQATNATLSGPVSNCEVNETCNPFYSVTYSATQAGIFKVVLSLRNSSDIATIEVRKPYVDSSNTIPSSLDKGQSVDFTVNTFNPQNESLMADAVQLKITKPDNSVDTVDMIKGTNSFTTTYGYNNAGNYITKIYASKDGFDTIEKTVITNVLKSAGVPLIIWVWIIMFGLIIVLIVGRAVIWKR